jgi:hypothetical protein
MSDASPVITAAPLSEGQRIINTFVAPSKTFADLLRSAAWWGPLLIMIVVSIVFSFAVQQKVGWDKVFENNTHQSPKQEERFSQMPPEQYASVKAVSAKIIAGTSYAYAVVLLIFTAIAALLAWAAVNFGFGGTATWSGVCRLYVLESGHEYQISSGCDLSLRRPRSRFFPAAESRRHQPWFLSEQRGSEVARFV